MYAAHACMGVPVKAPLRDICQAASRSATPCRHHLFAVTALGQAEADDVHDGEPKLTEIGRNPRWAVAAILDPGSVKRENSDLLASRNSRKITAGAGGSRDRLGFPSQQQNRQPPSASDCTLLARTCFQASI
ncbi:hypothetical protein NKH57_32240 [Mesorhizobium sp. M1050]|uniref:hypothetical protein n=1 Tax=Mesorhizobium sp. M1050 TaxID=2957051 RepID=UPI00333B9E94